MARRIMVKTRTVRVEEWKQKRSKCLRRETRNTKAGEGYAPMQRHKCRAQPHTNSRKSGGGGVRGGSVHGSGTVPGQRHAGRRRKT